MLNGSGGTPKSIKRWDLLKIRFFIYYVDFLPDLRLEWPTLVHLFLTFSRLRLIQPFSKLPSSKISNSPSGMTFVALISSSLAIKYTRKYSCNFLDLGVSPGRRGVLYTDADSSGIQQSIVDLLHGRSCYLFINLLSLHHWFIHFKKITVCRFTWKIVFKCNIFLYDHYLGIV